MRYHTEKPTITGKGVGELYFCNHPVYNECTLIKIRERGLAIIQQRYDLNTKYTWWGRVDGWIVNAIYIHPGFYEYFEKRAGKLADGIYPTVTVRQIMWALRMKPLKKEPWETVFDRRNI